PMSSVTGLRSAPMTCRRPWLRGRREKWSHRDDHPCAAATKRPSRLARNLLLSWPALLAFLVEILGKTNAFCVFQARDLCPRHHCAVAHRRRAVASANQGGDVALC